MTHAQQKAEFETLIDSGSDGDLITQEVVSRVNIPVEPLAPALQINTINGCVIHKVSPRTVPVTGTVSGNHTELVSFFLVETMRPPIILVFQSTLSSH